MQRCCKMKKLIAIIKVKYGGKEYKPGKYFQVERQEDIDFLIGGKHAYDPAVKKADPKPAQKDAK